MYFRELKISFQTALTTGKVVVLTGARQAGKSTLIHSVLPSAQTREFNFDLDADQDFFRHTSREKMELLVASMQQQGQNAIFVDEIQKLPKAFDGVKFIFDQYPQLKIVVSGSMALELQKNSFETLAGRAIHLKLLPLTPQEVYWQAKGVAEPTAEFKHFTVGSGALDILKHMALHGAYPKAYFSHDPQTEWETLANHIVFRDFGISQAQVPKLRHLLKLLALQTACLVSVDEISRLCELSKPTVYDYIQMLEALYVVYRLQPLDVADRHAISRGFKIYFWDLGLRNYFAQEFMPLDKHPQKGALFENLVLNQIRAQLAYQKVEAEIGYFRNANQSEVDVVIKHQGGEKLFECKFGKQRDSIHSRLFNRDIPCINQWNWLERIYGEL